MTFYFVAVSLSTVFISPKQYAQGNGNLVRCRIRSFLNISFSCIFYLQVRCVAGEEAIQAALHHDEDVSRNRTRSVISTLSRTTSLSTTPVDTPARGGEPSHHSNVDCIPPIPIFDLLAADKDDSGNIHRGMALQLSVYLSNVKVLVVLTK